MDVAAAFRTVEVAFEIALDIVGEFVTQQRCSVVPGLFADQRGAECAIVNALAVSAVVPLRAHKAIVPESESGSR